MQIEQSARPVALEVALEVAMGGDFMPRRDWRLQKSAPPRRGMAARRSHLFAMFFELTGPHEAQVGGFSEPGLHVQGEAAGDGLDAVQMLVASLALCSAAVLDEYAHGPLHIDPRNLRLRVRWEISHRPHRISRIEVEAVWPELPAERRDAVARAIASCAIHRTLEQPPELITRVRAGGEVEAVEAMAEYSAPDQR